MELSTRRYSRWRPGGAKDIPDGHETTHLCRMRKMIKQKKAVYRVTLVPLLRAKEDFSQYQYRQRLPRPSCQTGRLAFLRSFSRNKVTAANIALVVYTNLRLFFFFFFFLFIHYSCATYLDHDEGRAPICTVRFPAAVRV